MVALAERFAEAARRLAGPASPDRRRRIERSAVDFLACVGAGIGRAEAASAIMLAGHGETAVFGLETKFDPRGAALVMGTCGALLQLHDAFPEGGNHPSSAVASAVLVLRPLSDASLDAALGAIAAGYEIANRLALAGYPDQQRAGLTPTAVAGALGAAAASGLMLGLTDRQLAAAFGLAALTAPATPFQALREHGSATPLHGGFAARAGVEAALLAKGGAEAGARVLEGDGDTPGWLDAMHLPPATIAPEAWDGSTIDMVVWKLFPSCFASHPSIEAILAGPPIDPARIVSVAIGLPPAAMTLVSEGPKPAAQLYDRLMSVRWSVAVALLSGRYDLASIDSADPRLAALMAKVTTIADPDLAHLPAGRIGGRVDIRYASGEITRRLRLRALRGQAEPGEPRGSVSDPADPILDAKIAALAPGHTPASLLARFAPQA